MERDPGAGPGASWSLTLLARLLGGLEPSGPKETFLRFFLVILAPSTCVRPWGKFQGHPHMTPISRLAGRMHPPPELLLFWLLVSRLLPEATSAPASVSWGPWGTVMCHASLEPPYPLSRWRCLTRCGVFSLLASFDFLPRGWSWHCPFSLHHPLLLQ